MLISKNINLGFSPLSSSPVFQIRGSFFPLNVLILSHAERGCLSSCTSAVADPLEYEIPSSLRDDSHAKRILGVWSSVLCSLQDCVDVILFLQARTQRHQLFLPCGGITQDEV